MKLKEMAAGNFGNRVWYHGTTPKRFEKIKQTGFLTPSEADDMTFGAAVWLTSDLEEAREYGKVVLEIKNADVSRFKNKKISGYPHGYGKKYKVKSDHYHLVILEKIPLKYIKQV